MDVLVTGGTGFLGSHLAERLIAEGDRVRALVRNTSDAAWLESLGVDVVRGDVRDATCLRRAVDGCACVYHLAAATSHGKVKRDEIYAINVEGTRRLALAALEVGVERFVYTSSSGVYGTIRVSPVDEKSPTAPNSHYRRSKLLGEECVRSLRSERSLPVVIARVASVYGPRSVNWLGLFRAVARGRMRIAGRGENHLHLGYVSDIVEGIRRCGEAPDIEGRSYVIAGHEAIRLRDFLRAIADALGTGCTISSFPALPFNVASAIHNLAFRVAGAELPHNDVLDFHLSDRMFDITRARDELAYEPSVGLREGLRETLQWYRANGLL